MQAAIFSTTSAFFLSAAFLRRRFGNLAQTNTIVARHWAACCAALALPEPARDHWWSVICKHYSEDHRAYHTLAHIEETLNLVDQYRSFIDSPTAVTLGLFFHDIIYDPKSSSNEEDSAQLLDEFLKQPGLRRQAGDYRPVTDWIRATKLHKCAEHASFDEKLMLDVDMAILGAQPSRYCEYSRQVRTEYIHIPWKDFCQGRQKFLLTLIGGDTVFDSVSSSPQSLDDSHEAVQTLGRRIYQLDMLRDRFALHAIRNILAEISALRAGRSLTIADYARFETLKPAASVR